MKKFLSLVLALVMTMSLVTVSAGAKDFNDAEDIKYVEAVEVLNLIGVLEGYPDGSFQPNKVLTRAEAAAIIAKLLLTPEVAAELTADTAPFADVAADNWAAGYIAEGVQISQSAISHQLRMLKQMHLIKFRREGKNVLYSLADDHVKTILEMGLEHVLE